MDVNHAIDVVRTLAHHPVIHYEPRDGTDRFADTIVVRITWPGERNSNEVNAPDYREGGRPGAYADFPVYVGDCDEDELIARVIDASCDAFTHELREFTRTLRNGRWIAPFHPHRHPSIQAWSERTGRPVLADYQYGLA